MIKRTGGSLPTAPTTGNDAAKSSAQKPGTSFDSLIQKGGAKPAAKPAAGGVTTPSPHEAKLRQFQQEPTSLGAAGVSHVFTTFEKLAAQRKAGKMTDEKSVEQATQTSLSAIYGDDFVKSPLGKEAVNYIKRLVFESEDPTLRAKFASQGLMDSKGGDTP